MILGKKDVVRNEWRSKWTPAILAYSNGVRTKHTQTAVQEVKKLYTGIIACIVYNV